MLQHVLHVFVGETEIEQAHGALNLVLHLLFIETLNVLVEVLHANFGEIDLWTLYFLQSMKKNSIVPFFRL